MKKNITIALGMAAVAAFTSVSATAQVTLFSENFDPISSAGLVQIGFTFGDNTATTGTGVTAGVGVGGTAAWQIVDIASTGTAGFSGIGAQYQNQTISGATDANLSDYVLSFDAMATSTGGNAPSLTINIQTWTGQHFGGSQTGSLIAGNNGVGTISLPSTFTHFSLNLGDSSVFQTLQGSFTPAGGTYQIAMQLNGGGATPYTDTLIVDNFTLTQVPEPTTLALGAFGAMAGLIAIRRRK